MTVEQRPPVDRGSFKPRNDRSVFTERERADREKLDVLAGNRVGERRAAAVRVEDLTGILQIRSKLQATHAADAAAAPTQAEFNALTASYNNLFNDVERLHELLRVTAAALQRRITDK